VVRGGGGCRALVALIEKQQPLTAVVAKGPSRDWVWRCYSKNVITLITPEAEAIVSTRHYEKKMDNKILTNLKLQKVLEIVIPQQKMDHIYH